MSQESRDETALLPPLLRPEVFTNPGAADWVATMPAARPMAPWLTVSGSAVGLLMLVLAAALVEHRQAFRYSGALIPKSLFCAAEQDACSVDLQLVQQAIHRDDLTAGSTLDITATGKSRVQVRIVGDPLITRGLKEVPPAVRISWPKALPMPGGRIDVTGERVRTLLGWIMPRDRDSLASGTAR